MSDWYRDHEEDQTVVERFGGTIVVVLVALLLLLFSKSILFGTYAAITSGVR